MEASTLIVAVSTLIVLSLVILILKRAGEDAIAFLLIYGSLFTGMGVFYVVATTFAITGVFQTVVTFTAIISICMLIGAEVMWYVQFDESLVC